MMQTVKKLRAELKISCSSLNARFYFGPLLAFTGVTFAPGWRLPSEDTNPALSTVLEYFTKLMQEQSQGGYCIKDILKTSWRDQIEVHITLGGHELDVKDFTEEELTDLLHRRKQN